MAILPTTTNLLTFSSSFFFLAPTLLLLTAFSSGHRQTYIVHVDRDAKPSIFPTHAHWYESSLSSVVSEGTTDRRRTTAVIHSYDAVFHGFSARLSTSEVSRLESFPWVVSIIPEQVKRVHTTRSPQFLGLKTGDSVAGLLKESDFGSDLVIGVIDTGIWPERESFNDKDLGPVPAKWKGHCGNFPCNRKLIGARYFCAGYEATNGKMNETSESRSPRDSDGHGTHTASIAAGRYVFPASTLGYARGVAAGMAPKARLAAYKVCWLAGCYDSDILAAFDAAVADGVDVISLSVGGVVVPYYLDSIAIGAFGAMESGIFVSASAGNGGPGGLTVTNVAPWVTTVGAGTIDRDFPADVKLGNGRIVPGVSVYGGPTLSREKQYPLIYAGSVGSDGYSSSLCLEGSLNPEVVRGKIVLCDRGINSRAAKGEVVKKAGGVAMILANGAFDGEGLVADCHLLPATAVGASGGSEIRKYIQSSEKVSGSYATATIIFRGTRVNVGPAPIVASFSARGPNPETPEILKPDLIAPGLNILAAWPDNIGPSGLGSDKRRTEFNILSGTSMACPHVSGLAALLKAAHPEWSPGAIRSALMTTAYTVDRTGGGGSTMLDEATGNSSTAMDFGAGHVDPQRAMDPGLVYDVATYDYVDFLCNSNYTAKNIKSVTRKSADCSRAKRAGHIGNLNYPTLTAVFQQFGKPKLSTHFIRTVTNVGDPGSVYKVRIEPPRGLKVTVEPESLVFRRAGQRLNFLVRVRGEAVKLAPGGSVTRSGSIEWSDGKHLVRSPIVVTMQQPL